VVRRSRIRGWLRKIVLGNLDFEHGCSEEVKIFPFADSNRSSGARPK
jgi:hypothetical protein